MPGRDRVLDANEAKLTFLAHPIAEIFPAMLAEDYHKLVRSIAADGLIEPIWLFEGQILDGRHRYRACFEAGVAPQFRPFKGTHDEALAFSMSANLARRHMTTEQKAALGVSVKAYESEMARERQGTRTDIVENLPQGSEGKARDKAGEVVGVSGKTIDKAEKIAESAPDVFERMKQGQYGSVETASKVAALPEPARAEVHKAMDAGESPRAAVAKPHVSHNSGNNEWYTPAEFIEAARKVMGGIDLDPASSEIANRTVQADRFFTAEDNGLVHDWKGRVWMNPPYQSGLVDKFADKLLDEFSEGRVVEAIILVNNATETRWFQTMASVASAICFPKGRIRFIGSGGVMNSPLQGQAILYVGHRVRDFADVYGHHGFVAELS